MTSKFERNMRASYVSAYCEKWTQIYQQMTTLETYYGYNDMMTLVLIELFGLSEKTASSFILNAGKGDWKRMWETWGEATEDLVDIKRRLLYKVLCYSGCWTWDRVIEVQWLYQRLARRFQESGVVR